MTDFSFLIFEVMGGINAAFPGMWFTRSGIMAHRETAASWHTTPHLLPMQGVHTDRLACNLTDHHVFFFPSDVMW
jgi:hypothetical protein